MKRSHVTTSPVADKHHAAGERIIEFVFPNGKGGLISLRTTPEGACVVELYRLDDGINTIVGPDAYGWGSQ